MKMVVNFIGEASEKKLYDVCIMKRRRGGPEPVELVGGGKREGPPT